MRYKSKKGTIINIPDGLSAKQIAAIKADADSGYGTRAQQTADQLGKKLNKTPTVTPATPQPANGDVKFTDPGGQVSKGTVNPNGTINPVAASGDISGAETNDVNTNFQLEHPQLITDQNGNTREIVRHADGTVTVKDTKGGTAQTFTDLATAAAQSFNGVEDRKKAEEATYGTLTKYYDRDMAREREMAQQEMANRGIPYDPAAEQDPNTNNLYGKTLGAIGQKYRGLKDTAAQQAVISGNQAYATDAAGRDSFLNAAINGASTFGGNFGGYTNNTTTDSSGDTKDILQLSAAQYMAKYGVDQDTYTKKLAIAKSGSGGGKSSSGGGSGAGFEIIS